MPWTIEIDLEGRVVTVAAHGALTTEEFADGDQRVRETPGFDPTFDLIIDIRALDGSSISTEAVVAVSQHPRLVSKGSRLALVAATPEGFGMGRLFNLNTGREQLQIFDDLEEARRWISGATDGDPED